MWVATPDRPRRAAPPIWARLKQILDKTEFDAHVEGRCQRFYPDEIGRPGVERMVPVRKPAVARRLSELHSGR
jgi:hypothetical protein